MRRGGGVDTLNSDYMMTATLIHHVSVTARFNGVALSPDLRQQRGGWQQQHQHEPAPVWPQSLQVAAVFGSKLHLASSGQLPELRLQRNCKSDEVIHWNSWYAPSPSPPQTLAEYRQGVAEVWCWFWQDKSYSCWLFLLMKRSLYSWI